MNQEQLDKGQSLSKEIASTEEKLNKCQKALLEIQRDSSGAVPMYGRGTNEYCRLLVGAVTGVKDNYPAPVEIIITPEQMVYALIIAEKKIQKQLNQLTQEFDNL